jgi:hypothetical protein
MRFSVFRSVPLAMLILYSAAARAEWPAKVFIPYQYLGSGDNFKLTDCDDACGLKTYTLAFIIADKDNNPAWHGRAAMDKDLYRDQIDEIRRRGGDVLVSFGGAGGKELGWIETDLEALEKKYQSVIDQYKFTWLDFDIEGKALEDTAANERRNTVIARLQQKNPGLLISFTVPVDPNGLSKTTRKMLADAKAKSVKTHSANIMTMFFGPQHTTGKKLSDVCIASAKKAYEQTQAIDPEMQIGLCPMIGKGGEKGSELFSLQDAQELKDWAAQTPWICSLSYWSINRDSGRPSKGGENTRSGIEQEPLAFAKIFKEFAAGKK